MLEQNSVASSYIPTNGSTVQRAAETCNDSGNSEVFNDSQGVLFADIAANADDLTVKRINISDGSFNNAIRLGYSSTQNQVIAVVAANGIQAVLTHTLNDITSFNKLIIKYKENDFALWANGFEVSTDTSGVTPIGLDNLSFDFVDTGHFYGNTKEIAYYDTALTDAELETLTSYRSLNEMVTELNLNAL